MQKTVVPDPVHTPRKKPWTDPKWQVMNPARREALDRMLEGATPVRMDPALRP